MASELLRKQQLFASLIPRLIDYMVDTMGCQVTVGETWRTDEQAVINAMGESGRDALCAYLEQDVRFHGLAVAIKNNAKGNGILRSLHIERLAEDFNLFRNGLWLTGVEDFRPAGVYWKGLHPECAWGGDWGDDDHFSVTYQGRR